MLKDFPRRGVAREQGWGIDFTKLSVSVLNWVLEKLRDRNIRQGEKASGEEAQRVQSLEGSGEVCRAFPSSEPRVMLRGAWKMVFPSSRSVPC